MNNQQFDFEKFLLARGFRSMAGDLGLFAECTRAYERGPLMVIVTVIDLGDEKVAHVSAGLSDMSMPALQLKALPTNEVTADLMLNTLSMIEKKVSNAPSHNRRTASLAGAQKAQVEPEELLRALLDRTGSRRVIRFQRQR